MVRCEILCPWDLRDTDNMLRFRDIPSALGFHRGLAADPLSKQAPRDTLAEVDAPPRLPRQSDRGVLDQLAWQFVAGTIRVAVTLGKPPTVSPAIEA
ncbi:MAG TPA: hypothetical protein VF590_22480, partial [Isosphaeraceae bacterium]